MSETQQQFVIIVGGSGALGRALISQFNSLNYRTVSVDFCENKEASYNFTPTTARSKLALLAGFSKRVRLVFNAAGGWIDGSVADSDFCEKGNQMWEMNVESSILASSLASAHLSENGFLFLVGAKFVATRYVPDMMAYSLAKNAVLDLSFRLSHPNRIGIPATTSSVLLLPAILDTEANRRSMPEADFSKWTPPQHIAARVVGLMDSSSSSPELSLNGRAFFIETRAGSTQFECVQIKDLCHYHMFSAASDTEDKNKKIND